MSTLLRWQKKPPSRPNELASCSPDDLACWVQASRACSSYNFAWQNRIERPSGTRTAPSILKRERLMGFLPGCMMTALTSSAAKGNKQLKFATRASLVGNSISVRVLEWVMAQLAVHLGYRSRMPSRRELRDRCVKECLAAEHPGLGTSGGTKKCKYSHEAVLVVYLTSRAGSKGSGARITTGELLSPSKVRYRTVRSEWWTWRVCIATEFALQCPHQRAQSAWRVAPPSTQDQDTR